MPRRILAAITEPFYKEEFDKSHFRECSVMKEKLSKKVVEVRFVKTGDLKIINSCSQIVVTVVWLTPTTISKKLITCMQLSIGPNYDRIAERATVRG